MRELFGKMPDGKPVYLFTLKNSNGVKVQVTNYGAKLVSAFVPDQHGKLENVILGYSCLEHYLKGHPYLGATIGRVANRIAYANFELDGKIVHLTNNLGEHQLHGGKIGFDSQLWEVIDYKSDINQWVEFKLISPHEEEGYPGNLTAGIRYSLLEDNSIEIRMSAITDRTTVVNMTNHAYFNLTSGKTSDIYKHKVKLYASRFLKADKESIPTGDLLSVENTVLDFRRSTEIGNGINQDVDPVKKTMGYDQFFILDDFRKGSLSLMAEVHEPESRRVLQVYSTLPGMQFYTSNFLDTTYPTTLGKVCGKHSSFCIEPSYFPDAPNHSNFQSIRLAKGETYNELIVFKLSTR
jgi:aldose 1-epimerase